MGSQRSIETTGENVEEAIAKGLEELGVGPSDVIVEVLDEPSKGVLGLGARPARVRLQVLGLPASPPPEPDPPAPVREAVKPEPPERPQRPPSPPRQQEPDESPADDEDMEALSLFSVAEVVEEEDQDEEAIVGKVVLGEILERMSIRAEIVVRRPPPSADDESAPYILDVAGHDVSRLIGRRGETLASLQYLTRLVTSRELQRRANIIVDVDGYKARRSQQLYSLAVRMANQAVERNRTVALEPMPPYERRIIHLALRNREDVVTRSIGEGNGRKVTIVPK